MLSLFIRYSSLILCSLYIYVSTLNINTFFKNMYKYIFFIALSVSCLIMFLPIQEASTRITLMLIFSYILTTIVFHNDFSISIITLLISYGISFIFYTASNIIICTIFLSIYKTAKTIPYLYTILPTISLQILSVVILLKNLQIKRGLSQLIIRGKTHIGSTISLLFIVFISIISSNKNDFSKYIRHFTNFAFLSFSLLLLYYWRYRIKQTYIENMRRLETISYENAIIDRDKQIKELKQDNAEFGQIIHKYRKVIPAMELSVTELLQNSSTLSPEDLNDRAIALQTQLEELRCERNSLLDKYQKDTVVMAQSGLHTVDAMIALMEKRAKQEGIRYRTQIDPTLKELALNSVKESDLLHLLGDMVENAIHAVSLTEDKEILIHLGKLNDCLLLEISDSGISFDIQTYQHFGNEPFTSHQSDGGSGTGLMDIWKLKKEYKASLYIYEYSSEHEVYTKKISLLFDRKNHFLLKTYRDKEIKNSLIRGDLHVFPHQTD